MMTIDHFGSPQASKYRDVNTLQKNGLNNHKEASDLTEAVKHTLYEEYLKAYSER